MATQEKRIEQLGSIRKKQPYKIILDGIKLRVCKDVFPPELGYTSKYLAKTLSNYHPFNALDMGCGTGYLAFKLKINGVNNVFATDNHPPAIKCTKLNASLNKLESIKILHSDLFDTIPQIKFDLIVFNQPYYPATKKVVLGCGFDGGKKITHKFLKKAKDYLSPTGIILMPFSDMAGQENNPRKIAKKMKYKVKIVFEKKDCFGKHYIFEITN